MPIFIKGKQLNIQGDTSINKAIFNSDPLIKKHASEFCQKELRDVGPEYSLYLNQREYATASPSQDKVRYLGTDDATTCHMIAIRHTGSGVTSVGHFDGCDMINGLHGMLDSVKHLSKGKPDGRLDVYLVGGFLDDRKESDNISVNLLGEMASLDEELHLQLACISELNDIVRAGIHFPIVYGIAVEISTGDIFPARFPVKEPDLSIRSATHFSGVHHMPNIYDDNKGLLIIGPYEWKAMKVDGWLTAPDSVIRKHLSTSPEQEPSHFEAQVRENLATLKNHPYPLKTLFPNRQPRVYKLDEQGRWTRVQNTVS